MENVRLHNENLRVEISPAGEVVGFTNKDLDLLSDFTTSGVAPLRDKNWKIASRFRTQLTLTKIEESYEADICFALGKDRLDIRKTFRNMSDRPLKLSAKDTLAPGSFKSVFSAFKVQPYEEFSSQPT
jgi:hypothetical protein